MKVLVVDDDPISGLVLSEAVEELGHATLVRANGIEALSALEDDPCDLVISDWMMPKMDGLELCRSVRARPALLSPYFILLTVKGAPEDRVEALKAGADDFLIKPLDPVELAARLETAQRVLRGKMDAGGRSDPMARRNRQLGDVLVEMEILTRAELDALLCEQGVSPQHLETVLLTRGLVGEEELTRARAVVLDIPYVDVSREMPDQFTLALVPYELARQHKLMPLSLIGGADGGAKKLRVAMADPLDIETIDRVQRETRRRVEPLLASEVAILEALRRGYHDVHDVVHDAVLSDALLQANIKPVATSSFISGGTLDVADLLRQSDQAPVVRFVNTMLSDAVSRRASDIHLEPSLDDFRILYRIDGILQFIRSVNTSFLAPVLSRVKVMAELDIAERRLPQDGHITLSIENRAIDMRVATLPTQHGERVVIRLLDRTAAFLRFEQLGLSSVNLKLLTTLTQKPHGIVLVTGPTGSGKTTTLYAALNTLLPVSKEGRGQKNIITCEDPIEYQLDGISQSSASEKTGLTFARQLRAILRQDPDVVLIGEIRDGETADIAFRAGLTGHLVFSTLHCNEAAGAVSRLLDLGVAPYLVASSLTGVVAQRLIPRLCPLCCREIPLPDAARPHFVDISPPETVWEPVGCAQCDNLGVRGRIAIHEILTMTEAIQALIMGGADTRTIRAAAQKTGMQPMVTDGLEKVRQGLVPLDDVLWKTGRLGL